MTLQAKRQDLLPFSDKTQRRKDRTQTRDAEHSRFRVPRGDTACSAVLGPCRAALRRQMYQEAEPWQRFCWGGYFSAISSIQLSGGGDGTTAEEELPSSCHSFVPSCRHCYDYYQTLRRWTCALAQVVAEPPAVGKVGSQAQTTP